MQVIAPWFDFGDEYRHFQTVVLQRAAASSPLRKAIFATTARHLSCLNKFDPSVANRHYEECLRDLIPMTQHENAITDDTLLAVTIVLRLFEELESPNEDAEGELLENDVVLSPTPRQLAASIGSPEIQGYLFGIQVLVSAMEHDALTAGGLRQAALWTGIRQEIFMAFIAQRSIALSLSSSNFDQSLSPTDDHTWAFRMVLHCAEILTFAYGNGSDTISTQQREATWVELVNYCLQFVARRPSYFSPIHHAPPLPPRRVFPTILFNTEAHMVGALHFHLPFVVLALSNPTLSTTKVFPNDIFHQDRSSSLSCSIPARRASVRHGQAALDRLDADVKSNVMALRHRSCT